MVPAVVFAPSALVGSTNRWDERLGAPSLRLCDAGELRELSARGVEIGSHARTHRRLDRVDDAELREELVGSADELEAIGLPRPRLLSYPHGIAELGGTTNEQGRLLRARGHGGFLHLEIGLALRLRLKAEPELRRQLLRCLPEKQE